MSTAVTPRGGVNAGSSVRLPRRAGDAISRRAVSARRRRSRNTLSPTATHICSWAARASEDHAR
jgi:hypothetical protein